MAQGQGKTLVVYFSESGNTRNMANIISELSGADLVEIEMQHPYSDNYRHHTEFCVNAKS